MNEREHIMTDIEFRKVYLSDLNSLINIYRKTNPAQPTKPLTIHFGLPLNVAVQQREIIGFAAAAINEKGETEVLAYSLNPFEQSDIGSRLEKQAENILHETFENVTDEKKTLKNAIGQLVGWLNQCF